MISKRSLALRIHFHRKKRKLIQSHVAKALDINTRTWQSYETGATWIRLDHLQEFCEIIDIAIEEFLEECHVDVDREPSGDIVDILDDFRRERIIQCNFSNALEKSASKTT